MPTRACRPARRAIAARGASCSRALTLISPTPCPIAASSESPSWAGPLQMMRSGSTPSFSASQSSYGLTTSAPRPSRWSRESTQGTGFVLYEAYTSQRRPLGPVGPVKRAAFSRRRSASTTWSGEPHRSSRSRSRTPSSTSAPSPSRFSRQTERGSSSGGPPSTARRSVRLATARTARSMPDR